jgi:hypothetical protein
MSSSPPLNGLVPFSARDLVQRCNRVLARVESSRAKAHQRELDQRFGEERWEGWWPFRRPYRVTREQAAQEYGLPDEEGKGHFHTSRWWTDRAHNNWAAPYHSLLSAAENVDPLVTIWVNIDLATELH